MCMDIDESVTSLNKRVVWKMFDRQGGKIVSLFQGATYRKGKLVERSPGETSYTTGHGRHGTKGLHFFVSKTIAKLQASTWPNSYIAKFVVSPKDFMFASTSREEAMYEKATRVGNYIRVG
jgi:hypothetical protein